MENHRRRIEKFNNTKIGNYSVKNIQKIIKKNMDTKINFNTLLNLYLLQSSMNKATYQDNKNGHWALSLKYYSHLFSFLINGGKYIVGIVK